MDESSEEEEEDESEETPATADGVESVLPPPSTTAPVDLRKQQAGDETPKQLYQVLEQKRAAGGTGDAVFASEVAYVVPGQPSQPAAAAAGGAESVLTKAAPALKRKRKDDDEDESDLDKNFKF